MYKQVGLGNRAVAIISEVVMFIKHVKLIIIIKGVFISSIVFLSTSFLFAWGPSAALLPLPNIDNGSCSLPKNVNI